MPLCYYVMFIASSHWDADADADGWYRIWSLLQSGNQFSTVSYHIILYTCVWNRLRPYILPVVKCKSNQMDTRLPASLPACLPACIHNMTRSFRSIYVQCDDVSVYDFIMNIFMKMAKLFASNRIDGIKVWMKINPIFGISNQKKTREKRKRKTTRHSHLHTGSRFIDGIYS